MINPLRLIFMGTPEFALPTLDALVKAGHHVVSVYSQPPRPAGRGQKERLSPVHAFALAHNIAVHTPLTLKDEETQRLFREHNADAAIVAAYGLLLPPAILAATPMGCINVHPSLLPRWRGAAPLARTIMAGDKETGIVIMQMDKGLDTGDMLLTKHFSIPEGMNTGQLHDTLSQLAGPLVVETLAGLKGGSITPIKQSENGVTYAKKISKDECRINWNESAKNIRNKILGLAPTPGAFFLYKGEAIKILEATYITQNSRQKPGYVLDNNMMVACGSDAITILQVQRPGKKPMPVQEMLRGYPINSGELFES